MLILSRRSKQRVMIGDLILTLEGISKGKAYVSLTKGDVTEHYQGVADDVFHIAPDISVMVLDGVRRNQCRLGFSAPSDVSILREELVEDAA